MERNQIPYFSENCSIQHINWDTTLDNSDMITNPYDIANTFNNYFASIAETTKKFSATNFRSKFQPKVYLLKFCL